MRRVRRAPRFEAPRGDDLRGHGVVEPQPLGVAVPGVAAAVVREKSAQMQLELTPLIKMLFCETNPIPARAAVAALGFGENYVRLPLVPMTEGNKARMLELMREQGLNV